MTCYGNCLGANGVHVGTAPSRERPAISSFTARRGTHPTLAARARSDDNGGTARDGGHTLTAGRADRHGSAPPLASRGLFAASPHGFERYFADVAFVATRGCIPTSRCQQSQRIHAVC